MLHLLFYRFAYADHAVRREPYRADHLALAREAAARGELLLGGALAEPMDGAVLIFTSAEAASTFAEADPYVQSGLVKSREIRAWTTVVGALVK
ncbi:hypothetical protein D3875_18665 [Deinococcus cavernae]|uniref:YCII-related domain-containing protein n=1 Tax=Deinococcus cavernae TaxID=2320857 RepID=A0A418VAY8_9DEIO|nr:YciI-like protein [Deinococcus cavernae]RJF73273.1 hypothetical protein D3875_18665 [Deinococcus cavernae]